MKFENSKKESYLALIGLLLAISSLVVIYAGDISLFKSQNITFQDSNGDILFGKYHPGSKDAGIIILEGFSTDLMAMRSINSEFSSLGFHTFAFDFSGQGRSGGKLGFDNAATDRLAKQVLQAKEQFKSLSGLNGSQIILLGHSMGARVALQSATMDTNNVSGLILIGCQVNLIPNVQAGFFTGVSDLSLEWVQNLSAINPPADILLLSGALDDIITPEAANLLYEKLGADTSPFIRELEIYPLLFHNYEIYSPSLITKSMNWAVETLGLESNPKYLAAQALVRKIFWVIALLGLFMTPIFGAKYLTSVNKNSAEHVKEREKKNNEPNLEIKNLKRFYRYKLLLWLAAIPIAILLLSLFFFIPIGLPIFSLFYVGFIGSYGILMLILYYKGKVPGTEGILSINFKIDKEQIDKKLGISIGISIGFIILCSLFFNSGINYVFPLNMRLVWLLIFTLLTIPGFFIGQMEASLLKDSRYSSRKNQIWLWLIGLVPFFLLSILFAALGSISGMIGSIHGIIILVFVIVSGSFIAEISQKPIVAIIYQSFLIQLLVLTQGALFGIF
jgi:pimeloyl-ACP methyl ester carboxylesterase